MIHVVDIKNPFDLSEGYKHHKIQQADSVWDMLAQIGWTSVEYQLTITVGNVELPESEWGNPIPSGAHVGISRKIEGGIGFVIIAIVAAVSIVVALSFTIKAPEAPETQEPDPVFSLKGQTNQLKLNGEIEALYGYVRHWPSQAAKSYTKYINNEAWQFTLLCLGHGEIDVEQVYIEDTQIEEFKDVEYELVEPGGEVTLFPDNVETSPEVGSIELYGNNEGSYPDPDGWFTATMNSAGTSTDTLEVDVVMPQGIYRINSKGKTRPISAFAAFQARLIDDDDNPIGGWFPLINVTISGATTQAVRRTYTAAVPAGRYQVRGRRSGSASSSSRVADTMVWESARAYLPVVGTYGDVTMLAVSARATSNLNDSSRRKFNFRGTRKLPVWDGTDWTQPQATRNPVWAFCDIFRASYGPSLSDFYLHLDSLAAVATQLDTENKWFDWVFDTKQTVWEAARTCASSIRAIPLLDGSRIYLQEDRPKPFVQHLFNRENIIDGSFSMETSLAKVEDIDGIIIEYTDANTWKVETIKCVFDGSLENNMETVTLSGITDRDRAYREGMYMLSVKLKQRQQVTFRTGVEGFIATHSDLIKVDYDTFGVDGSYGGSILAVSSDRLTIQVDQEVAVDAGDILTVRGKDGTPYGPYTVSQGPSSDTLTLSTPLTTEVAFGNTIINPLFILGKPDNFARDCVITELRPQNDDTVEVIAMVYKPEIYDFDLEQAPPLEFPGTPIIDPDLPVVTGVTSAYVTGSTYDVGWNAATGATSYVIEVSTDDLDISDPSKVWVSEGTTSDTEIEITLSTSFAFVRVAGVGTAGQGPWAHHYIQNIGISRITPTGLLRVTPDGATRITRK